MSDGSRPRERVDNRVGVETPEAVEFELDLAGLVPRGAAWLIDGVLKVVVITVISVPMMVLGDAGGAAMLLLMFALSWLYNPLFEVFNGGRTPGKKALEIRVVNRDGTPVGWYGSIIRNLVRVVDGLPVGYVVGIIAMIVSGRFQRLGDLAGDTVVVYDGEQTATRDIKRLPDAEPIQIPVVLRPHEQEAIVDFAERSRALGRARSSELAGILRPMFDVATSSEAKEQTHGLAQRIVRWG